MTKLYLLQMASLTSHTTSCLLVYCGKSRRTSSAYASKTFWIVYNQHNMLRTLFRLRK